MTPKKRKEPDNVNHPAHYNQTEYEPIDVIEAWAEVSPIQSVWYHLGNTIKYIARAGHKGTALEDLKKARWYLDRAIKFLERKLAKEKATEAKKARSNKEAAR